VLIQTYKPDHYAVLAALHGDYQTFYRTELAKRRECGYPPFVRLACVRAESPEEEEARLAAVELADRFAKAAKEIKVLGPNKAPLFRLRGAYRYIILLKMRGAGKLNEAVRSVLRAVREERRGWKARIVVDVDPVSLL
jgi:primosomal protein N' (replication factor Y)